VLLTYVLILAVSRQFDGTSIKQYTLKEWRAGFVEHSGAIADHKAIAWDTQTVTIQYFSSGGASMTAYLVPGSPYMTFEYARATPLLWTMNGPISTFNGQALDTGLTKSATGSQFTVTDQKGATYLIYALDGSITLNAFGLSGAQSTLTASKPYNGVIRMVKLPKPEHKELLDTYSQTYPTSASTDYSFAKDGSTGTLSLSWSGIGSGQNLLMLTWPHHRMKITNPNFPPTSKLGYLTPKVSRSVFLFSYHCSSRCSNAQHFTGMDVPRPRKCMEDDVPAHLHLMGASPRPGRVLRRHSHQGS
jgi:endo-1,3(4)-beta-glucanase